MTNNLELLNYDSGKITQMAKKLFKEERAKTRLDGWFYIKEIAFKYREETKDLSNVLKISFLAEKIALELPIDISENAIFAGTQSDAFARSYALINPTFEVESFSGYCDPTAVFNDIKPNEEITSERIEKIRNFDKKSDYVKSLKETYEPITLYTGEVAFFVEQVTGHLIPDVRQLIANGTLSTIEQIKQKLKSEPDACKIEQYKAMEQSLKALNELAMRYNEIATKRANESLTETEKAKWELMANTLFNVPLNGAKSLYEAIQAFILIWQMMCIEQSPNPFAFSVGNADRIFEPYRKADNLSREETASLLKHLLVFYNVGDRSWAISQNLMISGRDEDGNDLTNDTSYALLDAYYDMNLPQPILSVKLHKNTPVKLYKEMGRLFFTPGMLTPSLFNDDSMFEVLKSGKVDSEDLKDYSIAGCQEPLIMGKDNANTTNSWLNLAKILELTLNDGKSLISDVQINPAKQLDTKELLENIREEFYKNLKFYVQEMVQAANNASRAISLLPTPFLSTLMGGIESGIDVRDTTRQGTKYNGSGCLIHGIAVVADSFVAIDEFLKQRPKDAPLLLEALRANYEGYEDIREFLLSCPKYGNNIETADEEAVKLIKKVSKIVSSQKNYLGNPFRPDYSTPSTHLLYGHWVGALPDGRKAREMLNYGIDPLHGDASSGLGFRILSNWKLPFETMQGGYASHFGINPGYFKADTYEGKGEEFYNRVIKQLFFNEGNKNLSPFYLYVNVTTPQILRKVLSNPKKYAPSGVYIMRIHGTFVNFLDLSPAIQEDIILRLDLKSTNI